MTMEVAPIPLPLSADPSYFEDFGREIRNVDVGNLTAEQFREISNLLYKHNLLVFRNALLSPEQQYALTKAFDPSSESYGHGNNKVDKQPKSLLNSILKTIPRVPQVQLIGNGVVNEHEGILKATLKHPSHRTFHRSQVSEEDEAGGITRFNRWHFDAALYELSPPKVTTLYGLCVPKGPHQTVRYDDGSGEELDVPLAATAFVSGKTMFDILPKELKSVAIRAKVRYAPHTFTWMATAKALPTGLGMESEGREVPLNDLPAWDENKIKTWPVLWKNPVTGNLHFQVHPCGATELFVEPLKLNKRYENALYPDGAHLTNLKEVRELLYKMQRPAIAPFLVYPHDWQEKDLVIFHNRGVMHTVVGALNDDQKRVYHQCNLAASDDPVGPSEEDISRWA